MPGWSDLEQRIRRLAERQIEADRRTRKLADDVGAFAEAVAGIGSAASGSRGACRISFSGIVQSACNEAAVPNCVVDFVAKPSGIPAGTLASDDDGLIAGTLSIMRGDTSLDYTATSAIEGLNNATGTVTSLACDGSFDATISLPLDSDYVCWLGYAEPVAKSYKPTVEDPLYGDIELTWNPSLNHWSGQKNPNYAGCGGCSPACSSVSGIYLGYVLYPNGVGGLSIFSSIVSGCPVADSSTALPPRGSNGAVAVTSSSPPPSFGATFNFTPGGVSILNALYNRTARTFTVR